jgi:hypothetical protein
MLAAFAKAAIPDPVVCLGIPLKEFSLGHLLLLRRHECSFLTGEVATLGDLLLAVLLCSQDFAGGQKLLNDPDLHKDIALWRRRLAGPWWVRWVKPRPINFLQASKLFEDYLIAAHQFPVVQAEMRQDNKPVGSPWPLLTLCGLMARLHLPLNEAVNMPLPLARWLVAGAGEVDGAVTIVDPTELEAAKKEADEFAAELFKGRN